MTPKTIFDSDDSDTLVNVLARITSITPLNSDVVELVLALDQPLAYHAGQNSLFFVPYYPDPAKDQGSYSFVCGFTPEIAYTIQFHIRKMRGGLFSEWLFDWKRTGEQVVLEGPFGSFAQIRPLTPSGRYKRTAGVLGLCVRQTPVTNT